MLTKEQVKELCLNHIESKILHLESALKNTQDAANNETKSSAGDKYETGRAMAHLETERLLRQKNELLLQKNELLTIQTEHTNKNVGFGSLIKTKEYSFYLSVGLGQIEPNLFIIGRESPLAKQLWGQSVGFKFNLGPKETKIASIL